MGVTLSSVYPELARRIERLQCGLMEAYQLMTRKLFFALSSITTIIISCEFTLSSFQSTLLRPVILFGISLSSLRHEPVCYNKHWLFVILNVVKDLID